MLDRCRVVEVSTIWRKVIMWKVRRDKRGRREELRTIPPKRI